MGEQADFPTLHRRAVRFLQQRVKNFFIKWATFTWALARLGVMRRRVPNQSEQHVVVSLTSIPKRISTVWMTIESILRQSVPPAAVVLVLSEQQFPRRNIPRSLSRYASRGVTFIWEEGDIGSFKKLLPALSMFPDSHILTVDDDAIYRRDMISLFLQKSAERGGAIVGSRGKLVPTPTPQSELAPYDSWPMAHVNDSGNILLTGLGGVLYPAGSFNNTPVLERQLAQELCRMQDDVWFWAMAMLSGRKRAVTLDSVFTQIPGAHYERGLYAKNRLPGGNDASVRKVIDFFELDLSAG